MTNSIKTAFDKLFSDGYKKKYYYLNGDESVVYSSSSSIIEISLYLTETYQRRLHFSVQKDGIYAGIPSIPYLDLHEQKHLTECIFTSSIKEQIQVLKSYLEKNIEFLS
jgi:hypothetical protein